MNVQGLNEITKRQSIEKWALEKKIDVVMVQETRINDTSKEEKPNTFGISAQARSLRIKNKWKKESSWR